MKVVWSDLALESLANIYQYVKEFFGYQKAEEVAADIVDFADCLGRMPRIGIMDDDWAVHGEVRRAVVGHNFIYYQIDEDNLKIIIVWDTRQNPTRLKRLISRSFEEKTK